MTYPDHWLCSFGGALGSAGKEHWSCGIRMVLYTPPGSGTELDEEQWLEEQGEVALTAWILRATSHIGAMAFLDFVKLNRIGPDGNYADPNNPHTRFIPHVQAGGGTSVMPFSAAVCVTTRTAFLAGPASKGRFYQPLPDFSCGTDGKFNGAYAAEIADSARILMDNLEVAIGPPPASTFRPNVVSAIGSGTVHLITHCSVDNRMDTQRRRSNQLVGIISQSADIDY